IRYMSFFMSIIDYKSALIRSVLAMAVGILFCIFPTEMAKWSVIVIGGIIVFGAVMSFAVKGFAKQRQLTPGDFLQLIFLVLFGIFVIWENAFFARFIMLCLGLLLVIGGGSQLSVVIGSRRVLGVPLPFTAYLMPSALIVVGLLVCFKPFQSIEMLFVIFGIGAIFYGANDLFTQIRLRKQLKKMGKVIRHGDVEDIEYEEVK
ncbi:MAG: DUF4407 domain-containing protein, partial [Bacteroidales bacterium]|nr:DUF4407 domain-containing protein [Bacteroidales bacterium]